MTVQIVPMSKQEMAAAPDTVTSAMKRSIMFKPIIVDEGWENQSAGGIVYAVPVKVRPTLYGVAFVARDGDWMLQGAPGPRVCTERLDQALSWFYGLVEYASWGPPAELAYDDWDLGLIKMQIAVPGPATKQ